MSKGKKPTPAAILIKQLLTLFPNTPTLTLAKKAYSLHPELWTDLEGARSMIRFYRGASGKGSRGHQNHTRPFTKELFNPFNLPESDEAEYLPFILPDMSTKVLWMSDVHVPFHSIEAVTAALEVGVMEQVDCIFLGGDFMDFYAISSYEKDPRKRSFMEELKTGKEMLQRIREVFPEQAIFFLVGNHEERLEKYMRVKAPELLDCEAFQIEELLDLRSLGIHVIKDKRMVHAGDLTLLHGHEFGRGSGGVFPARSLLNKAHTAAICGHWHRPSDFAVNDVQGNVIRSYSTGCLCELHPEYMPLNDWQHGCAIISIDEGHATVQNLRIKDGRVI